MNNELNTHMHNWTNLSLCGKKHFRESMCEEKHFGEMSERLSSCSFREKKLASSYLNYSHTTPKKLETLHIANKAINNVTQSC